MTVDKLLILDDDVLTAQTIGNIAGVSGYAVELTTNHRDFFRQLAAWQPQVIALDLIMPEMDGVEVIAELARQQSTCKIIITSGVGGRVMDAAARTATERGLDIVGVLPKPFTPSSLRELLKKCHPGREPEKANGQPAVTLQKAWLKSKLTPQELVRALNTDQLYVCFQPKVSCQTGILAGFEVLARWAHPLRGNVPPDEFIPLAEAHDLIDTLTMNVMSKALEWFRDFRAALAELDPAQTGVQDPDKLMLSLNISALCLGNAKLFDHLTGICGEHGIPPHSLILELTETSAMRDPVSSLELLTRLRLKGFRLSIDDFGTGYSSMVQLVKLPFSEIKVDKSFVITARESEESKAVIKSVVSLGMSLGLIITAEGIEDEETLAFLRNIGCNLAQGYYIAKPLRGDKVLPWLTSRGHGSEEHRLHTLHTLRMLDTPGEERFDSIIRLTKRMLDMPMCAFALVDSDRLWFKSRSGIPKPAVERAGSFCTYTIGKKEVSVIPDALEDKEFSRFHLVVNAPHIRFYAGCPIHAADGAVIGTLFVLDLKPRSLNAAEIEVLKALGRQLERELYAQAQDEIDPVTKLFNQSLSERRIPEILHLGEQLMLPCALRVYELLNVTDGGDADMGKKGHYLLSSFARILQENLDEVEFIGRFDNNKFLILQIHPDEKLDKMARWKIESAVRQHNQNALPELEINYRFGSASTLPSYDYQLQSLLDKADRV